MATVNGFTGAWSVQGGGHSSQLLRVLAYAGTNGSEGIVSPADCKVSPLATPGAGVRIDPGAILMRNRSSGARNQTYVADGSAETTLDIPNTVGQGARHDLVVIRMRDPQYTPWTGTVPSGDLATFKPAEPFADINVPTGSFDFSRLGRGYSGYALARIEWPANTTAITAGMIKDVRELAQPHFDQHLEMQSGIQRQLLITETNWVNWPNNSATIRIPRWCTHVQAMIDMEGIHVEGPGDAETRVQLGTMYGPQGPGLDYNGSVGTPVGFVETLGHATFGEFDVRSIAGTTVTMRLNAKRVWTENKGRIEVVPATKVKFDVRFLERLA
jgi:hypothetical protein